LGCLLPARTWCSLNTRPFRYFPRCPCPRKRLLGQSSHGVRPSFTVFPDIPACGLSTEGTSLGVLCPFNAQGGGNPRLVRLPARAAPVPRVSPTAPTLPTTVPLSGFPNLSAASFSLRPPAIFRQVAFLGFCPSGVCFLSRRPGGSSPPACPHDVSPAGCASPSPRQGSQQARQPLPRMKRLSSFFVFRASVRGRIGLSPSSHD
jgi:hypothetical protein